jgi:aldehyde dehydrogenase (NAD+)
MNSRQSTSSASLSGIFSAGGQTCMAGSRLLLQESISDMAPMA